MERADRIRFVNETKKTIHQLIVQEHPRSILTIGEGVSFREGFFPWEQKNGTGRKGQGKLPCAVTRLAHHFLEGNPFADIDVVFQSNERLAQPSYDMIVVADLFEAVPVPVALDILNRLLEKAKKQVLVLCTKLRPGAGASMNNGVRDYHPVVFQRYDFTYLLLGREHENQTQLYSFYPTRPQKQVRPMAHHVPNTAALRALRLAYLLPDQDLTGGMKQLVMQMKEMHRRGHQVFAYTKSETAQSALPRWSGMTEGDVDGQFVLKPSEAYLAHIGKVDAIILGWMEQAPEVRDALAPVFLWEQGSSPLFGDFGKPLAGSSAELARFRACYRPPVQLLAVSPLVQTVLRARFGRGSAVVSAAVDALPVLPEKPTHSTKQILLVGNGERVFKNFSFAIDTLVRAKSQGARFEVQWVTPTQPARDMVPKGMKVDFHVAPPQEKLVAFYRSADLFVSHSLYESFSLPPLEAMAAGTAVLAVNSGGIEAYAVHGENCLLCEQGDVQGFANGILRLLEDDGLREHLATNGRIAASEFSVQKMCDSLEQSLRAGLKAPM